MQAWCRVIRVALGQASSAQSICLNQAHGIRKHATMYNAISHTLGLSELASGCGRGMATLTGRAALPCPSKLSGALQHTVASGLPCPTLQPGSVWNSLVGQVRWCAPSQLSRVRVPKGAAINDVIMPNTTQLKYGIYGIRALSGKRVAANTLEAVRKSIRRKIKKTARLWIRIAATVPVTRKPQGLRMGKGKGAIAFYATAVRPGQIIFEFDRLPRTVAVQALQAAQAKFPVKLGLVEWS